MTEQSKVVTTAEVLAMTRVGRTALYTSLLKSKNFPKPFKLGIRKNAWFRAEVEAWINTRAAGVPA